MRHAIPRNPMPPPPTSPRARARTASSRADHPADPVGNHAPQPAQKRRAKRSQSSGTIPDRTNPISGGVPREARPDDLPERDRAAVDNPAMFERPFPRRSRRQTNPIFRKSLKCRGVTSKNRPAKAQAKTSANSPQRCVPNKANGGLGRLGPKVPRRLILPLPQFEGRAGGVIGGQGCPSRGLPREPSGPSRPASCGRRASWYARDKTRARWSPNRPQKFRRPRRANPPGFAPPRRRAP